MGSDPSGSDTRGQNKLRRTHPSSAIERNLVVTGPGTEEEGDEKCKVTLVTITVLRDVTDMPITGQDATGGVCFPELTIRLLEDAGPIPGLEEGRGH